MQDPDLRQRQLALYNATCVHASFGDAELAQVTLRGAPPSGSTLAPPAQHQSCCTLRLPTTCSATYTDQTANLCIWHLCQGARDLSHSRCQMTQRDGQPALCVHASVHYTMLSPSMRTSALLSYSRRAPVHRCHHGRSGLRAGPTGSGDGQAAGVPAGARHHCNYASSLFARAYGCQSARILQMPFVCCAIYNIQNLAMTLLIIGTVCEEVPMLYGGRSMRNCFFSMSGVGLASTLTLLPLRCGR